MEKMEIEEIIKNKNKIINKGTEKDILNLYFIDYAIKFLYNQRHSSLDSDSRLNLLLLSDKDFIEWDINAFKKFGHIFNYKRPFLTAKDFKAIRFSLFIKTDYDSLFKKHQTFKILKYQIRTYINEISKIRNLLDMENLMHEHIFIIKHLFTLISKKKAIDKAKKILYLDGSEIGFRADCDYEARFSNRINNNQNIDQIVQDIIKNAVILKSLITATKMFLDKDITLEPYKLYLSELELEVKFQHKMLIKSLNLISKLKSPFLKSEDDDFTYNEDIEKVWFEKIVRIYDVKDWDKINVKISSEDVDALVYEGGPFRLSNCYLDIVENTIEYYF